MSFKFSLYADWGYEFEKNNKKNMFYLPVSDKVPLKSVKIKSSGTDKISMVIEIDIQEDKKKGQSSPAENKKQERPGLQQKGHDAGTWVAPGVTSVVGGTIIELSETSLKMNIKDLFQYLCGKVSWFKSWCEANRIPAEIRYEGLKEVTVKKDQKIGYEIAVKEQGEEINVLAGGKWRLGIPGQEIKVSIYYSDGKPMNPVEFFSLLFWQEEYDPVYKGKLEGEKYVFGDLNKYQFESWSESKSHPLINKIMTSKMNGDSGTPRDDNWMGLRPPLRTYKRVEWEAKRELALHFNSWQRDGSVEGRIKTPNIEMNVGKGGKGYKGYSKCNIFVGEMAYRSGFKTFIAFGRSRSGKDKFFGPDELTERQDFGEKVGDTQSIQIEQINNEIKNGKCIIYARPKHPYYERDKDNKMWEKELIGHVVILKEIIKIKVLQLETVKKGEKIYKKVKEKEVEEEAGNDIEQKFDLVEAFVIDQHCDHRSHFAPRRVGGKNAFMLLSSPPKRGVFIKLNPDDDPKLD
ncbi:MAG: hypothetical protein QXR45_06565 [Candidatus Bathyarchaeia archaeon]